MMVSSSAFTLMVSPFPKQSQTSLLQDPETQPKSSPLSALLRATANNRFELWKLGITHVLNAAHGGLYCQGGPDFYGSSVCYLGIPAHDLPDFNISPYFSSAADFIHRALTVPGGRTQDAIGLERLEPLSWETAVPLGSVTLDKPVCLSLGFCFL
jgi:hypothetical protein